MEVMFRLMVAAALLAGVPAFTQAQSSSAPLVVTATVVSTCHVSSPRQAEPARFSTLPIAITCARGRVTPRVQMPAAPRRSEVRDALLVIDF
jgi:hypothetical protein